jgi:hypothetical protein
MVPLVTVMNYSDPKEIAMCKGWIYLASRFCPHAQIIILHRDPIPDIASFAEKVGATTAAMSTDWVPDPDGCGIYGRPAQRFKIGMWKWLVENKVDRFVFVDADAWIVGDISRLFAAADQKAFVATTERILTQPDEGPTGPLLNTGSFSYVACDRFRITPETFLEELKKCGGKIVVPTGDQGLLWSLFNRIGYDWELPEIGPEYNTFANGISIEKLGDEIVVRAAEKPPVDVEKWVKMWIGWGNPEQARIVHAISGYKWWTLPETEPLWNYVMAEVARVEGGRAVPASAARPSAPRKKLITTGWTVRYSKPPERAKRKASFTPGLVSIVMPTYNRPALVQHAIGMIRQQTHQNIQIVIVDDSTENLQGGNCSAPDIKYIRLKSKFSMGAKHDIALDAADGEWICHWDDDDWFARDRVERQLAFMAAEKAQVCGIGRDLVLSTDGAWWRIVKPVGDKSWIGNGHGRALYDFHDGTAIFRKDAIPSSASYGDYQISQKEVFLNSLLRSGAKWCRLENDGKFVYIRHALNTWRFDEERVRRPADRPAWFPDHEYQFYLEAGRKI